MSVHENSSPTLHKYKSITKKKFRSNKTLYKICMNKDIQQHADKEIDKMSGEIDR